MIDHDGVEVETLYEAQDISRRTGDRRVGTSLVKGILELEHEEIDLAVDDQDRPVMEFAAQ